MKQNLVGNVFSVVCLSALLVACGKQEQAVSARPAVQVARADFDMAANELADTRLLAPFDGYVQQTYIERHQTVRPQQAVVTFIDLSQVKAEVYVPEDMAVALRAVTLGRLLAGSRVEVTAGLATGQTIALTRLAFLSEGQTVQAEDPTATEGGRP